MLLLYGGNGFLGAHIAEIAVEAGLSVAVIGRGAVPSGRLPNPIDYAQAGTQDARGLAEAADMLVYLAHDSRPANEADGLSHELSVNLAPLTALLHQLGESAFAGQFVYASSGGQIYGRGLSRPAREDDPVAPTTTYGTGKRLCEIAVDHAARNAGLQALTLRLANPVGRHQIGTGHGLFGAVFKALRDDAPLWLFGEGENVRDYFAADDLGRFLVDLHQRGYRGSGTYNIGSGTGLTERDVLARIDAVIGQAPPVEWKPARDFDLPYAVVDARKAVSDLGWSARTRLGDVIRRMADHAD